MTATVPVSDVDVAVVGGGISGLAAAWRAHARGLRVAVLESHATVGGKIRSESRDGYLTEWGPNSFLGSAATIWQLIEALDLGAEVVTALPPGDRYIYRNRRARRLPKGPADFFRSPDFMTLGGKLRLLAEPFVFGDAAESDTLMAFARRRLGAEAAQYLVAPFVAGIYAGDAEQLGARDAFPQLWQWEHEAGSVVMGALLNGPATPRASGPRRRGMFNFRNGFATLPLAIASALPAGSVRTGWVAQVLTADGDKRWRLTLRATHEPTQEAQVTARQVILATPPRAAADILRGPAFLEDARRALEDVTLCRVAVVHFGGRDPDRLAPQGFGMLIPPGEGLRTLGILFPSSVFGDRAPAGHYLHTAFLGGARDPDAADLPDETLLSLARRAQEEAFPGVAALQQDFAQIVRWREAIPQYRVGHRQRMMAARAAVEAGLPGVTLAGNYLDGISVNDAAASGIAALDRLLPAAAPAVTKRAG